MKWIVPATHEHLTTVVPQLASLPLLRAYHQDASSFLTALTRGAARGEHVRVLLDKEESPLGLAWFLRRGGFGAGAYLRFLATVPGCEGLGLGSQLLEDFESSSDAPPGGWFALVSEDNVRAQAFYQRHLYRQVGKLPGFVRADKTECIFHKAQK